MHDSVKTLKEECIEYSIQLLQGVNADISDRALRTRMLRIAEELIRAANKPGSPGVKIEGVTINAPNDKHLFI